jgi:hypothetical protein
MEENKNKKILGKMEILIHPTKSKSKRGETKNRKERLGQMSKSSDQGMRYPKYEAGMSYTDFEMKYLIVASTKENAKEIVLGQFIGKIEKLKAKLTGEAKSENSDIGTDSEEEEVESEDSGTDKEDPKSGLTPLKNTEKTPQRMPFNEKRKQQEEKRNQRILKKIANISKENARVFADLVTNMTPGKLTRLAFQSKTEKFPEGCAGTAWKNIKSKIGEFTSSNKQALKEEFKSSEPLLAGRSPAKYIDRLKEISRISTVMSEMKKTSLIKL